MKNYTRSYILGGLLLAIAFLLLFTDDRWTVVNGRKASWLFFIGGMIVSLIGWVEHSRSAPRKKNQ